MVHEDITRALNAAGVNSASLDRIRLARGVVGKSSYVAGAAIFAIAVVAFSLRDPFYLFCLAPLSAFIFITYFIGALWFAHKNPGLALLEGAELIQWRQMEMAVKGHVAIPKQENVAAPLLENGGEQ